MLRVLIAGGGIGGLCLAQGLHQAGADVTVFERAAAPDAFKEGYRIHIDPDGSRALHACLPAERFALFESACGRPPEAFAFLTEQLTELLSVDVLKAGARPDPIAAHRSINRFTLRQILLDGLGDRVRFGKELRRYETAPDGTVTAYFADGGRATGDVLVGAEGTHSRVRAQLLPHAERADTGVDGIAGRLPLTPQTLSLLPAHLHRGPAMVLAPGGRNVFLATHQYRSGTDLPEHLQPADRGDYLVWGLSARRATLPRTGLDRMPRARLHCLAQDLAATWHPHLRRIIQESAPATVSAFTIRTAVPVAAWPPSTVTVLGDAIHSMPPSRGIGANTALRDAELLCRSLVAAGSHPAGVTAAIGGYERQMREYGFAAVKASVQALRQSVTGNPVAFTVSKVALRMFNAVPAIRDRVFG
ncbi:FAD-dependent oxidoreductase [Planobispora siamensis]|uniref:FAD-dependent oxidoreductase n=1 Tax=Planobispora siamensis TaxID=936338 RepID=A0A8J3WJZ3_9ACTN|nr:FAD-dependent monooxygenase [Planobispora siamensis]GIH93499.1 FAD-dependent oxidoreductase [Planobispora siamensis]